MSKDWEKFFEQGNQAFESDNLEQAESFFRAALAAAEESGNELNTALCSERLGELLFETQRYREAEPCFKRTLEIRDRLLAPHDDFVVAALNNLSALYFFEGNHELAEEPCKRLTEIYEQVLGSDNPEVATSVNNLALIYAAQGKNRQAEELFKRALSVKESALEIGRAHV